MARVSQHTSLFLMGGDNEIGLEHSQCIDDGDTPRTSVWAIDGYNGITIHATPDQLRRFGERLVFAANAEQSRRYTLGLEQMPQDAGADEEPEPTEDESARYYAETGTL